MTAHYRILPAADADLDDQAVHLGREANLETALRFYDAVADAFEDLARMPGLGEQRRATNKHLKGVRVWPIKGFERHLIFYRQVADGIEIIRVLHGARDIDHILRSQT